MGSDGSKNIKLIKGDITAVESDAVVNAANSSLMGGGGVDGAIHRAGGPAILEECKEIIARIGRCEPGRAVYTSAGDLPARYVIHTVGPVWKGGNNNEAELLTSCYRNSLDLASELGCESIAFPNISTGVYGYPKLDAAEVAIRTISEWEKNNSEMKVLIVCFDEENYRIYLDKLSE